MSETHYDTPSALIRVASAQWDAAAVATHMGMEPIAVFPAVAHGGIAHRRPPGTSADEDVSHFVFYAEDGIMSVQVARAGEALKRLASSAIPDDLRTWIAVDREYDEGDIAMLSTDFLADLVRCRGSVRM